ncbi:MAG: acyl-CoA dehydrogenase family protein [Rhodospirillales bacterium]|nr:acyl-CoA dehydrogenase family protein [Rhodospirillales bacterium]
MELTETQEMIRDAARAYAQEKLWPTAAAREKERLFPRALVREMGALGFMGMLVPEEFDGAGVDHVAYALAIEEIAAGDGAVSTVMSVHNSVGCMPILKFGSDWQKETFLKPLARGDMLGAFALTEPSVGSDAGAIKTRARRDGNHWVVNGSKQFITSGGTADLAIIFAVTNPEAGKKGISAFLVPTDTPGWKAARIEEKLGQKCSDTAHIVMEDMRLTPDLMLGAEGEGYRIALANLEGGRIGIAAQAVGMARSAYAVARDYALQRETFGQKIFDHQAVQFRLSDMATELEAARLLVVNAARLRDAGKPCLKEAAMAKLFASEMAERVCSAAIQTHGGYGYLADFPVERIWRDVRVCQIYEGTSDIQRLVIARAIRTEA